MSDCLGRLCSVHHISFFIYHMFEHSRTLNLRYPNFICTLCSLNRKILESSDLERRSDLDLMTFAVWIYDRLSHFFVKTCSNISSVEIFIWQICDSMLKTVTISVVATQGKETPRKTEYRPNTKGLLLKATCPLVRHIMARYRINKEVNILLGVFHRNLNNF